MRFDSKVNFGRHLLNCFAYGVGALLLVSALSGIGANAAEITADDATDRDITGDATMTVTDAADAFVLFGTISGTGPLVKNGAGTLNITGNNTFSGGVNIDAGTLKVSLALPAGSQTADYTPLGTGTVMIGDNGKLVWNPTQPAKTNEVNCNLTNTITGTGTLRMEMGQKHGNTNFSLNNKLSDFTGTLELANYTRIEWSVGTNEQFNKISTIRIENGSELWTSGGGATTFESDFILNGNGAGAGGDTAARGVFRLGSAATFNGAISLESNSFICAEYSTQATFQNDIDLAGYQLNLGRSLGGSDRSTITLSGNITAGKLVVDNQANVTTKIATSADANYAKDQTIAANIAQNNTSNALVFDVAENRTITETGVISGSGAVTKDGAGTLIFAGNNTFSGGMTIDNGIVTTPVGTDRTSTAEVNNYSFGSGPITINENSTLIWYNEYNYDQLPNVIKGAGRLVLDAVHDQARNANENMDGKLAEFTGTLELQNHARLHISSSNFGQTSHVIVNDSAGFWGNGGTFNADFIISGDGKLSGGDTTPRGAIVNSGDNIYNGSITLADNSMIGMRDDNPSVRLNGNIHTAGHALDVQQTHKNGGKFYLTGNVTSVGTTGTPVALGQMKFSQSGTYSVFIGDDTAAGTATTQRIDASVNYSNTSGVLTFQPGENRTIEIAGELSGNGSVVKTGAGTLTLLDAAPISGTLTVEGGTVNWAPTTYNNNGSQVGYASGITALTVRGGATMNQNTYSNALTTVNVEEGTLNLNYVFRNIGGAKVGVSQSSNITVGTEDGKTAVLNVTQKGFGDHTGTLTIYKGGTVNMNGADISLANSNTVKFIGGGEIRSASGNCYFNFRGNGNQKFVVEGANAQATIASNINLYDGGFGSVDVQEADSTLTISGSVRAGSTSEIGFNKTGAGTLVLSGSSYFRRLQVSEGTTIITGNGNIVPFTNSNKKYGVNVAVKDGATLVIDNACNFTKADITPDAETPNTFTFEDNATLIVNHDGWQMTDVIEDALTKGTLGGSGRIVGNIDTTGLTISPGHNSLATLTFDGNLKLSNGTIILEVGADKTQHDKLAVTGEVDFSDVTFMLQNRGEASGIELGDMVELVSAQNLTSDILNKVAVDTSGFDFSYEGGNWGIKIEDGKLYAVARDASAIPEPATWVLLLCGLGMFVFRRSKVQ